MAACAPIPVKRDVGQVNFNYNVQKSGAPTSKLVGIVSPEMANQQQTAQPSISNPLVVAMLQQGAMSKSFSATQKYSQSYESQLKTALDNTFSSIVSNKGFNTAGPYATFDDITYTEKKDLYLAVVPRLTLNLAQKTTHSKCETKCCVEEGTISIGGEMLLKVIEPLAKQSMINKRINLSDFSINKQYVRQWEVKGEQGLAGLVLKDLKRF